jgi:integrase/recombinase XerC
MNDLLLVPAEAHAAPLLAPFTADAQRALVADFDAWLQAQVAQGQRSDGTRATYARALVLWLSYLEQQARTDGPTPGTVSAFLAAVIPGRQPATVNLLLGSVRALYAWAEAHDRYPNVARSVNGLRVHRSGALPCLDHSGVGALLALVAGDDLRAHRDRALLATMYGSGVRCVSLHRATVGDLDAVGGTLRHQGKGHRAADAVAYLPSGTVRALGLYLAARHAQVPVVPEQPLFIALDHAAFGAPLSGCSMNRIIRRLMERAGHARRGPDGRLLNGRVFTAHSIRRSAVTTAADTVGIEAAAAFANHSSPEVTRRAYVRSKLDGQMRVAASALDLRVE